MSYDPKFYELYGDYLKENSVRDAHDFVLKISRKNKNLDSVIDIGCGAWNEYLERDTGKKRYGYYSGVDLNWNSFNKIKSFLLKELTFDCDTRRFKGKELDYRNLDLLIQYIKERNFFTGFVSLFSTEITAPYLENYEFYKAIFERTQLKSGLVSGFYYSNRKEQEKVYETGGIISFQTIESLEDVKNDVFSEIRIVLPVPSKMFGDDVIEVWKFFERI